MAPFALFSSKSGGRRSSKDTQGNGGGTSSKHLCEVSGNDHFFSSTSSLSSSVISDSKKLVLPQAPQIRGRRRYSTSILRTDLCTSTSNALRAPSLQQRSKDHVQRILFTQSCKVASPPLLVFPSPTAHWLYRDAVQQGYAKGCAECGKHPQAIEDLCLGCNSAVAKSAESRLRELDPQDPNAATSTFRTSTI